MVQLWSRSAKKRRISGTQGREEQQEPNVALGCIKGLVMVNTKDRITFNQITEEYCQLEKLHLMEVAAVADKAYTWALTEFPQLAA